MPVDFFKPPAKVVKQRKNLRDFEGSIDNPLNRKAYQ
jgi:hypothetical protein